MPDFITGATGCVGRYLVRALLARGRDLICAVRRPDALADDSLFRSPGVVLVYCDFTVEGWEKQIVAPLSSCQTVFHVAGAMPHTLPSRSRADLLRRVNVEAVQKLYTLAATAGVTQFIFVSSLAVYGDSFQEPCDERTPLAPVDTYASTKAEAERILTEGASNGGPAALIIRPGLIYGDRDTGVIQKMIDLISRGYFLILGDGRNTRSMSAAPLVTDTLCGLVESKERLLVVDTVDPCLLTLGCLTADIAGLLGVAPPRRIPLAVIYPVATVFSLLDFVGVHTNFKISDVRKISTSTQVRGERLREVLGHVPDYYREALAADVDWYRRRQSA